MRREGSDSFEVAVATPTDHAAIAAILEDVQHWLASCGIAQWTTLFTDDWIEEKIALKEFHIARLGNTPVAVVRLLWADPRFWRDREQRDAVYIHTMAVRRDHAGLGIGGRVVRWAGKQARDLGRRFLRLDCGVDNLALRAYYRQLGFTTQGSVRVGGTTVMLLEMDLND